MSEAAHIHPAPTSFIRKYVFSTDHKVIGKQYLAVSLFWALIGALAILFVRWQLAYPGTPVPGSGLLSEEFWEDSWLAQTLFYGMVEGIVEPEFYNKMFTMHGTIMVFFVAMPLLLGAFGNFLVPLMIGARDMAFPRLNMMSIWTLVIASTVLALSFFVEGGAAAGGWTAYPPLSAVPEYTEVYWGQHLWILAVALEFASFLMGGVNILTTTINMRAPGLTWGRLPMMVWIQCTAAVLFLLSVGPLIAGAAMLFLDRVAGTHFYIPSGGGEPLLWQHLFWFFGHPEVYVIMIPGMAMALEIFPVFCRKPIFGYRLIIWSIIAAGLLSFVVWAHHMYQSGLDPRLAMPFSITTIIISVPFALIVFAMIATLWGGSISFPTPMLFSIGTLLVFLVGGLSGIFNGAPPADIYIHDTYFVVAHFHYTLISATFFGGFAGIYFWFPKMTGRMMNEFLGKIHFWLTFIFFNLVFGVMHTVGIGGMMRRIANPLLYDHLVVLQPMNIFISICAFCLIFGQAFFVINLFVSLIAGRRAPANPWQATTLEWRTSSPPPHHNFDTIPVVHHGPYEYSAPGTPDNEDWLPQDRALAPESPTAT